MSENLYYWAENLDGYSSDNEQDYDQIIEIKRLNFFIGKNNAGKSRFLRNLFLSDNRTKLYKPALSRNDVLEALNPLYKILEDSNTYKISFYDENEKINSLDKYINYIKKVTRDVCFLPINIENSLTDLSCIPAIYVRAGNSHSSNGRYFLNEISSRLKQFNPKDTPYTFYSAFYVPTLRHLRPLTDKTIDHPNLDRTLKDYFKNFECQNSTNQIEKKGMSLNQRMNPAEYKYVITGENIYEELKKYLLGEPEQRELIKNYEEKLSQYFFDNEAITLIPKHDQDVVNIKIGADRQFPISDLGDGLQQAIILTYEAYIKSKNKAGKDEIHAFFIEEPELHMHAGMVRQLMNFYLNETKHYYFFTTHSNHLLDMADESDQVIIQKFVKQAKQDDEKQFEFKIYRCDRDRDLLASLGVKPSSVYLANCTIWVEGITDRLYITKYMEKYLSELKESNLELFKKYRRFMPNYHYTFVEYAGSNLVHWSFSDEFAEHLSDQGMNALLTTSSVLLIADGDIQTKGSRVEQLSETLGEKFVLLKCKETENTLSSNLISMACHIKFSGLNKALENDSSLKLKLNDYLSIDGMLASTKEGFDINYLNEDVNFFHAKDGIGKIIDTKIKVGNPRTTDNKQKKCFSDSSGTIKEKLKFCRLILTLMEHLDWELTDSAKDICEKVFAHIEKCNS